MNRIKDYTKKLVLLGLRTIECIKSWTALPLYARFYRLHLFRLSPLKLAVSLPFKGVFNGQEEMGRTLDIVVGLLKSQGIDYFIVPSRGSKVSVAVMAEHRERALMLINKNRQLRGYYCRVQKEQHNTGLARLIDSTSLTRGAKNVLAVSIYRNIGGRGQRVVWGDLYEVTLEFWLEPNDLSARMKQRSMDEAGLMDEVALEGAIIAPIANGVAKVVAAEDQKPAKLTVAGTEHPTLAIFTEKSLSEVSFPIDVVYTWVNGADPEWLKKYEAARQEIDPDFKNNSIGRYSDHDELKYSLRSVEMYAPWVRNIYIVTDGQTPQWLDVGGQSRVKIINHKAIFSDESALPVFNSHAIESQLHHIPGLSEHYLYLNDDMFFARPTTPETFFYANGIAKIHPSSATIGTGVASSYETAPSSAGKNARKIISDKFGVYVTNKYRHTFYPQRKSIAEQVEKENAAQLEETMRSKFRSANDLPFTTTLMQSYLLASRHGVPSTYSAMTINVSEPSSVFDMNQALAQRNLVTLCLNEALTDESEVEIVGARVDNFLKTYFPFPSRWEK